MEAFFYFKGFELKVMYGTFVYGYLYLLSRGYTENRILVWVNVFLFFSFFFFFFFNHINPILLGHLTIRIL